MSILCLFSSGVETTKTLPWIRRRADRVGRRRRYSSPHRRVRTGSVEAWGSTQLLVQTEENNNKVYNRTGSVDSWGSTILLVETKENNNKVHNPTGSVEVWGSTLLLVQTEEYCNSVEAFNFKTYL